MLPKAAFIWSKNNKNSNIVKYSWNLEWLFSIVIYVIYSCDGKAEISASLLQSSVSHDPSEIIWWFAANLLIYIYI